MDFDIKKWKKELSNFIGEKAKRNENLIADYLENGIDVVFNALSQSQKKVAELESKLKEVMD